MTDNRKQQARQVRISAAELAYNREHPRHIANGDEQKFRYFDKESKKNNPSYLASFTKGMPHCDETGLVSDPNDFQQFVQGIDSGDPRDFNDTRLGRGEGTTEHPPGTLEAPEWRSTKSKGAKVRAWGQGMLMIWKDLMHIHSLCHRHLQSAVMN